MGRRKKRTRKKKGKKKKQDGDSGMGFGSTKWGEDTGSVDYDSVSDSEDSATEGAGKQRDLSYLVKAKAMLEHNNKMMEKIAKLVRPTYDSDDEKPVASDEEKPVTSNEEEIEWVMGEVQGYKYRVPKEFAEKVKQMDRFELLQDICARQKRIAEKLARNMKGMGALTKFAKAIDKADEIAPPASRLPLQEQTSASESLDNLQAYRCWFLKRLLDEGSKSK